MVSTLVMLGTVSLACAVIERVMQETTKASWCQYVSIVGLVFLGLTALQGVKSLFDFILTM